MAKVDVQVQVSKETHELGKAVEEILRAARVAAEDGWDTATDLPAVLVTAATQLVTAVEGIDQLDDELKEDPEAFIKAIGLPVMSGVGLFLKKAE